MISVAIAGFDIGSMILVKILKLDVPSIRAASSALWVYPHKSISTPGCQTEFHGHNIHENQTHIAVYQSDFYSASC